jgi:uncharacterized protein (DUF305 family)
MKRVRTTPAAVALAAVLALAAGCGNSGDYGSPTVSGSASSTDGSAAHNAADVTFAQTMIPHHRQAMTMAEVAQTRAANPDVKELAAKIEAEQGREIQTMTKWLEAWGAPTAPAGGMDHGSMPGMDHGSMPGMMTDADMGKMMAAKGVQLDRMFLTMMIEHHIGAVDMAKTEQAKGQNPEAKALAKTIETAQTAEIAQMRRLLEKLA